MPVPDFVPGDAIGLPMPAHAAALRAGGPEWLTRAFRAFGSIAPDNAVTRITRCDPCPGGSTGHKLFLSVEYAVAGPGLHRDLFVKFSRDFDDPVRDRGRGEMESEARFAALSHEAGFPIPVPAAYFADYQAETGTGMLVTQAVAFGEGGIEPHHLKCMDHLLPDALDHYRAIIRALARLAAAHRAGRLSATIDAQFPYDPAAAAASDPIRFDEGELRAQVAAYAAFVRRSPQLVPAHLADPAFIAKLDGDVGRILRAEAAIKHVLANDPDLIALCHWNAHIDNAWFWRDAAGTLQCGLMDWGRVRQLNLAFALWGCLSGAELEIWDDHLDELLGLFADECRAHGGPRLAVDTLRTHLILYATTMGTAQLLEAPARILYRLPEAVDAAGPHDPVFLKSETARNQLHIVTVLLNMWARHDPAALLGRIAAPPG